MVKALLSYIDALETDLNTQLPGVLAGETEPVHEFRVDLKKTRTVLNFIHFWLYGHSSKTVLYRKIRPVFRLSKKTDSLLPVWSDPEPVRFRLESSSIDPELPGRHPG